MSPDMWISSVLSVHSCVLLLGHKSQDENGVLGCPLELLCQTPDAVPEAPHLQTNVQAAPLSSVCLITDLEIFTIISLDWSTNMESSIAHSLSVIYTSSRPLVKLFLYFLLLLLFLLHRFLLCPFSLIPDVLLVLYHFTPKFNALTSHLSGIFLYIFSDIEKQRYKSCLICYHIYVK